MRFLRRHRGLSGLLAVQLWIGAPAAVRAGESTAATETESRTRLLFRQAGKAFSAGRFDEARRLLAEAWSLRQSYDIAAALGQSELELKLYRSAAEHLDFAVRNFAPVESEQSLAGIKQGLAEARRHVASVRVEVNLPQAEILVNGERVGVAPLGRELFLDPGDHSLEARLGAERRVKQFARFDEGASYTVTLIVPEPRAESPLTDARTAEPAAHREPRDYTAPVVTASVAGVALTTSLILVLVAEAKDSDREALLGGLRGDNPCAPRPDRPTECGRIEDLAHQTTAFRNVALASLGVGALAGAATYFLWPKNDSSEASFQVSPSFGTASGVGLRANARF